jgi:serine/threonine protein kinase
MLVFVFLSYLFGFFTSPDVFIRYETSSHLWLVLEYCVGGDLMTLLRQVPTT